MKIDRLPKNDYIKTKEGKFEHRIIYEKHFGKIPQGHQIHHVNALKYDNNIDNLIAIPWRFHQWLHKSHKFYIRLARAKYIDKRYIEILLKKYKNKTFNFRNSFKNVHYNHMETLSETYSVAKKEIHFEYKTQIEKLENIIEKEKTIVKNAKTNSKTFNKIITKIESVNLNLLKSSQLIGILEDIKHLCKEKI